MGNRFERANNKPFYFSDKENYKTKSNLRKKIYFCTPKIKNIFSTISQ